MSRSKRLGIIGRAVAVIAVASAGATVGYVVGQNEPYPAGTRTVLEFDTDEWGAAQLGGSDLASVYHLDRWTTPGTIGLDNTLTLPGTCEQARAGREDAPDMLDGVALVDDVFDPLVELLCND